MNLRTYLLSFFTVVMLSVNAQWLRAQSNSVDPTQQISKVAQTYYYLNNYYLDTLNFPSITDRVLQGIVKELDPHSLYISAKDVKAMSEPLEGNFDGVGVEFALILDTLTVQATVPGGPSEKVGIRAGDKIVKVDEEVISGTGLTIERVHGYLRGKKGTKVTVAIKRKGVEGLIDFTITRDKIPLNSLDASYVIENDIVYLKLSRFAATSYKEIMEALNKLRVAPKGIILDLRGNSGGYLVEALKIANEFLNRGELILYTEGRTVKRTNEYATGSGTLKNVPVTVLIDENSASASEIVSGAIQDWDRGIVIGRRSFGKGLVQQQLPLQDGAQLRLTIARYHTPSGRVIQTPYEQGDAEGYYKKTIERYVRGEQFNKDSIQMPDSLKYKTLKLGRTVYGGGGIMPDIFMPQDTSFYTPFYGEIVRKGTLTDFVNSYIDINRAKLESKYKSAAKFASNFEVTPELFNDFIAFAKESGIEPKEEQIAISKAEFVKYIKAFILRGLFDFNTYLEYINATDEEVLKAVEVLLSLPHSSKRRLISSCIH